MAGNQSSTYLRRRGTWTRPSTTKAPERNDSPPAPPPLPRPGAWAGVSEIGAEEEDLVGVLRTLLPKQSPVGCDELL